MKVENVDEKLVANLNGVEPSQCAFILRQFRQANLMGIRNMPTFLMLCIKHFQERIRRLGLPAALAKPLLSAPPPDRLKVRFFLSDFLKIQLFYLGTFGSNGVFDRSY